MTPIVILYEESHTYIDDLYFPLTIVPAGLGSCQVSYSPAISLSPHTSLCPHLPPLPCLTSRCPTQQSRALLTMQGPDLPSSVLTTSEVSALLVYSPYTHTLFTVVNRVCGHSSPHQDAFSGLKHVESSITAR